MLKVGDKPSVSAGPLAGLSYSYGLSDQFNFVVEGTYARVAFREPLVPEGDTWKIESFHVRREIQPKAPKASASTSPSGSA